MNSKAMALAVTLLSAAGVQAQPSQPVAGKMVLGVSAEEIQGLAVGYRVSKLIGQTVYNDQQQKIGKIGDLIVRPDGALSFAIVDVGGFLGMGSRHVAIPVKQFASVKPKVVLAGATKEALKEMPAFEYSK